MHKKLLILLFLRQSLFIYSAEQSQTLDTMLEASASNLTQNLKSMLQDVEELNDSYTIEKQLEYAQLLSHAPTHFIVNEQSAHVLAQQQLERLSLTGSPKIRCSAQFSLAQLLLKNRAADQIRAINLLTMLSGNDETESTLKNQAYLTLIEALKKQTLSDEKLKEIYVVSEKLTFSEDKNLKIASLEYLSTLRPSHPCYTVSTISDHIAQYLKLNTNLSETQIITSVRKHLLECNDPVEWKKYNQELRGTKNQILLRMPFSLPVLPIIVLADIATLGYFDVGAKVMDKIDGNFRKKLWELHALVPESQRNYSIFS